MGARDRIRETAQPFLEPGENVQATFAAQTGPNPKWFFLTVLIMFFAKYFAIVVTDRRILVLRTSSFRPAAAKDVAATASRETKLGPVSGLWGEITLDGAKYYVHRRYFKDVEAADAARGSTAETQPAPSAG